MNSETLKTFKECMGVAYTALEIDQYIPKLEIITASDGCEFEILRPFFEGSWKNWTDRDRFLAIAKEHGLEVEDEISQYASYSSDCDLDYIITVGNTKIKLETSSFQLIHIYNEHHHLSIQTFTTVDNEKLVTVTYARGGFIKPNYHEAALGDIGGVYLNDIQEIATLDSDIPIIKELIAQLLV